MGISRIVEIVKDGDQGHCGYRKSFVGVGGGGVGFERLWGFVVFVVEVGVEGVLGLAFQNQCSETFHHPNVELIIRTKPSKCNSPKR